MIIEARSIVKAYQVGLITVLALNGVDVLIQEGEMVAVTGASGSGKSTLMHIIGCLDLPDSGTYVLAGEDVSRLSANRLAEIRNRRIGFVFQSFNLLPRLSALENVELPLLYAGKTAGAKERARKALQRMGLEDRMDHEPAKLSGGERQRVAIARAIVSEPSNIMADEPTGNLDTKTEAEIIKLFKELNRQGRTIIIVTHEPEIAEQCGRQIRLRDGKILGP